MTIKELDNLHEGNFARFRIPPSEFHAWRDELRPSTVSTKASNPM